jgi:hypothetical protein
MARSPSTAGPETTLSTPPKLSQPYPVPSLRTCSKLPFTSWSKVFGSAPEAGGAGVGVLPGFDGGAVGGAVVVGLGEAVAVGGGGGGGVGADVGGGIYPAANEASSIRAV